MLLFVAYLCVVTAPILVFVVPDFVLQQQKCSEKLFCLIWLTRERKKDQSLLLYRVIWCMSVLLLLPLLFVTCVFVQLFQSLFLPPSCRFVVYWRHTATGGTVSLFSFSAKWISELKSFRKRSAANSFELMVGLNWRFKRVVITLDQHFRS